MSNEPAYIKNLKELTRGPLESHELFDVENEMYKSGDRTAIIVSSSIVEYNLRILLEKKLDSARLSSDDRKKLFGSEGILGTFSAQITMAFVLGYFNSDTQHDLNLIRILRNALAHSRKPFKFSTPQIVEFCKYFKAPEAEDVFIRHGPFLYSLTDDSADALKDMKQPKSRFLATCYTICRRMIDTHTQLNPEHVNLEDPDDVAASLEADELERTEYLYDS